MSDKTFPGVRPAREPDAAQVYELMMLAHQENGIAPVSEQKVLEALARGLSQQGAFIGVIEGPDRLEGMIGLALGQWWYSEQWHLEEVVTFVHADHRKSTHAKHLYRYAKWLADKLGVELHCSVMTKDRLFPKLRLAQREMQQIGATFVAGRTNSPDEFFNQRHPPEVRNGHG